MTSHDVVARIRRLARTRRVGHAGTLDPMATGVLVVGVEKATRLLGHLTLADKDYLATIRLGQATDTDDAEGSVIASASAAALAEPTPCAPRSCRLTGQIEQVPPGVSAIKVGGQRAYRLTREGAAPELKARPVTVAVVRGARGPPGRGPARRGRGRHLLQRDLRPRPGPRSRGRTGRGRPPDRAAPDPGPGRYRIETAQTLDELAGHFTVTPLADAAAAAFPRLDLTEEQARKVAHGARLPAAGLGAGPAAVFGPDGTLIALMREEEGQARPLAVFVP